MKKFSELGLHNNLLKALDKQGYTHPTPIQAQAIPVVLSGKDVFGCAQTGTGKTAAFSLPVLQLLSEKQITGGSHRPIRALIITPTRELAIQISENIKHYATNTNLKQTTVFGGVSQFHQVKSIKRGVDVVVATPGRLLDLVNQKIIKLGDVETLILDEADRMLDMGFIHDIRKILGHLPSKRQNLFFSATMSGEIMKLARTILHKPVTIKISPNSSTVETIEQSLYTVAKPDKRQLLLHILDNPEVKTAIVFSKTKHGANKLEKMLRKKGISSAAIHGNKSQFARQKALRAIKNGKVRVLVATDVAARGIDINLLSHVIIYDVPLEAESYVHRIGRTGRAKASGQAIMFCTPEELKYFQQVIKLIKQEIPLVKDHPYHHEFSLTAKPPRNNKGGGRRRNRGQHSRRSSGRNKRRRSNPNKQHSHNNNSQQGSRGKTRNKKKSSYNSHRSSQQSGKK